MSRHTICFQMSYPQLKNAAKARVSTLHPEKTALQYYNLVRQQAECCL